jgi:hypothetical protein
VRQPAPEKPKTNETKMYVEIGSYMDKPERALRFGPMRAKFTAEQCMNECGPQYKYFSLQYNGQCFCENDLDHATKYGKAECGKEGGTWCNFIYEQLP